MSSDNVVFDVDTQETIFSEIALNAQQTIKAMSGIGYGLATHGDFLPRLTSRLNSWDGQERKIKRS